MSPADQFEVIFEFTMVKAWTSPCGREVDGTFPQPNLKFPGIGEARGISTFGKGMRGFAGVIDFIEGRLVLSSLGKPSLYRRLVQNWGRYFFLCEYYVVVPSYVFQYRLRLYW